MYFTSSDESEASSSNGKIFKIKFALYTYAIFMFEDWVIYINPLLNSFVKEILWSIPLHNKFIKYRFKCNSND